LAYERRKPFHNTLSSITLAFKSGQHDLVYGMQSALISLVIIVVVTAILLNELCI